MSSLLVRGDSIRGRRMRGRKRSVTTVSSSSVLVRGDRIRGRIMRGRKRKRKGEEVQVRKGGAL